MYQLIRPSSVLIFLENQNKSNLKVSSVESTADCRLENREYKVSLNKYQKLVWISFYSIDRCECFNLLWQSSVNMHSGFILDERFCTKCQISFRDSWKVRDKIHEKSMNLDSFSKTSAAFDKKIFVTLKVRRNLFWIRCNKVLSKLKVKYRKFEISLVPVRKKGKRPV